MTQPKSYCLPHNPPLQVFTIRTTVTRLTQCHDHLNLLPSVLRGLHFDLKIKNLVVMRMCTGPFRHWLQECCKALYYNFQVCCLHHTLVLGDIEKTWFNYCLPKYYDYYHYCQQNTAGHITLAQSQPPNLAEVPQKNSPLWLKCVIVYSTTISTT